MTVSEEEMRRYKRHVIESAARGEPTERRLLAWAQGDEDALVRPDITIPVAGHVLDYRDTAEIARALAILRTLGFVPLAEYLARPYTVPEDQRRLPGWATGTAILAAADGGAGEGEETDERGIPGRCHDSR
jgi:hypothetical protein